MAGGGDQLPGDAQRRKAGPAVGPGDDLRRLLVRRDVSKAAVPGKDGVGVMEVGQLLLRHQQRHAPALQLPRQAHVVAVAVGQQQVGNGVQRQAALLQRPEERRQRTGPVGVQQQAAGFGGEVKGIGVAVAEEYHTITHLA